MATDTSPEDSATDVRSRHRRAAEEYLDWSPQMYVDGEWTAAESGGTFETVDPTTGEPLAEVPAAGEPDVDAAVRAASAAYDATWSDVDTAERRDLLNAIADRLDDAVERLASIETLDNGMPVTDARVYVSEAAEEFRYFAGISQANHGTTVPTGGGRTVLTSREPYGTVGAIIPWNFPLLQASWKLAPALAAGNAVVIKPAEQTPLSLLALVQEVADLLPPGVLNVVTGFGEPAGSALAAHEGVEKLAFTGSTEVGKRVMKAAADNVTDVSLELGGNSPVVVFPDVDPERAADVVASAALSNTGENCCAGARLFVHENVESELLEALSEAVAEFEPGDPLKESTTLGPKVSGPQQDRTLGYVRKAEESDATVLTGGGPPDDEALADGYFVSPTVVTDLEHGHPSVQEEVFGPVLEVFAWSDYDRMMELANGVEQGLAGGVLASDVADARAAARDLEAGTVWVNQYNDFPQGMPFGGYKQSGIGRERAFETIEAYTQTKTINLSGDPI